MSYSLDDKITRYLEDKGIPGARVKELIIVLPLGENGEWHRKISGVINAAKLDIVIDAYREAIAE